MLPTGVGVKQTTVLLMTMMPVDHNDLYGTIIHSGTHMLVKPTVL